MDIKFLKEELKRICKKIEFYNRRFSYEFRMVNKRYDSYVCLADWLSAEILKILKNNK